MKANKKLRIPSLRFCNKRGFVDLNGNRIYLGPWGEPATKVAYERTIAEWIGNKQLPTISPDEITVTELCRDFWVHCKGYYVNSKGEPTSTIESIRRALKPLREQYGDVLAKDVGPNVIRAIRTQWVDRGLSRSTINAYVSIIKRQFKWAASHERIPITTFQSIATLEGLRAGRSEAKESVPVRPVPEEHIAAIKSYVSRQVWALVQVQLLTGARSGELLELRPCDLDTNGDTWCYELEKHKTSYRGKKRTILFGPQAQKILLEFMDTTPIHGYLFSPLKALKERHENSQTHRRPNQPITPKLTDREVGEHYTNDSYRRAITRACKMAEVPSWTPHRLRHNAATCIRRQYGLEAAQVILGHSSADVTQIYAEADTLKALAVIQEIG